MRLSRIYLPLSFVFSLLAVSCSDTVSGSGSDENLSESEVVEPEDDELSSAEEFDRSSSSSKKESSGKSEDSEEPLSEDDSKSSSSAKNSSSSEESPDEPDSGSSASVLAGSSSSKKSSSSVSWSYTPEKPYVMESSPWNVSSSPSSEKKQPSLGRVYPYNLYVSVPWSFSNTDPTPSFYDPDLFTEPTYTWVNADNLGEVNFSKFYYTKLNVPVNSSFVTYSFYPTGARRYLISVDKVSGEDKPLLRVLGKNENNEEALIEPVEKNGRWYYTLDAAVLGFTDKLVTLVRYVYESGYYSMYGRRATNFIISDEYGGYTKNFNVNLIVAGKFMGTSDNVTVEELAERLYARLNYALNPGGVGVRKVNILYANDHPTVGKDFPPSDAVVLYRDRAKRPASLDSLSNWPGHEGEINFILGYYEGEASSVGGYSPQPGEIYNDHKPINCESSSITNRQVPCLTNVSILTHLDGGKQALASRNITSSAIHELGHFFGLEHTSSWGSSPEFDKLSDTPECTNIEAKASVLKECPDYGYIMFPYSNYEFEYTTFTPRQMEIIRAYLASVPHK